ncbi:hypothetical protein [Halococcus agarilyticus]|uniref:hypothetical protein n=1 Tax=Halococcus agarilyticus TaxID=1232219 RepID=UPI0012AC3324|nr:hypothetical protein [Halococcus agarilyticus]
MISFSADVFVIFGTVLVSSAFASSRLFEFFSRIGVPGGFYGRAVSSSVLGVGAGLVTTWIVVGLINATTFGVGT